MRATKIMMVSFFAFAVFGLVSCQDNNRQNQSENETLNIDAETETRMGVDSGSNEEGSGGADESLADVIRDNPDLTDFSRNLNNPDMSNVLERGEGPYTVFASSNSAYDELSDEERNRANSLAGASANLLIVEEELSQEELRQEVRNSNNQYSLMTMGGETIIVEFDGEELLLRDGNGNIATITDSDTDPFNGIVHTIDAVLQPEPGSGW